MVTQQGCRTQIEGEMSGTFNGVEPDPLQPSTVLVVDDDAAVGRLLSLTLRDSGFNVVSAANGEAALERVESTHPVAIVLDLEMPVMDGRSFYRELRRRGIGTPVLLVSAHDVRAARRELGADGAVQKPFDPFNLVDELRALI